jgi:UDP-glucose 4-epimerase
MQVLVTGGAGYIGSHMVLLLQRAGHEVVVVDDLSSGHRQAVPAGVELVEADVGDAARLGDVLRAHRIQAILHFASRIQVGESVAHPRRYYTGNLAAAVALLETSLDAGVAHFVLSSTAAVYGHPARVLMGEDHPTEPASPYGETKLAIERMLASYRRAYGLGFVALRYFNAAGADPDASLGERHDPETHLIPLVLDVALGRRPQVTVFGRDYDTPDGTAVRDYVHVLDLCEAHLLALEHLSAGGDGGVFNLGTGVGHSVAEVIEVARRVTGREIRVEYGPRRPGDPAWLVASPDRAARVLGWRAKRASLEPIVRDAWRARSSG